MALHEEFVDTGNWLFRWRSYLPLLVFVLIVAGMISHPGQGGAAHPAWALSCLGVSLFGFALRLHAVGHTPGCTSGRNRTRQVAETLNTTGLYSLMRHPLYFANFFAWLGIALFPAVWWVVALYALAFWLFYERIMFAEEAFLRERFGAEFDRWASRSPAFWPMPGGWQAPALSFSVRRVLRREYSGLLGLFTAFALLDAGGNALAGQRPVPDRLWLVLVAIGLAAAVTLRMVKKKTHLLEEPGR